MLAGTFDAMAASARERQILVVGGAGYIGSVLTRRLLGSGHSVRVLDSLLYGNGGSLATVADDPRFAFVRGDVRSRQDVYAALDGITDVVLLAALVGDPVCKRNPVLATETNLDGTRNVLAAADDASVERLVFASTCSNYGMRPDDSPATEHDELHPLSLYAETKVEIEHEILRAKRAFAVTVLRVATAFGISPRMRFDLTVSEFTRELAVGNTLEVYDPDTWRPYCHIADISEAITAVLEAPPESVEGEIFNVGSEEGNQTKRSILEAVQAALGTDGQVIWSEGGVDARNYRVAFGKIRERLGFETRHSVRDAVAHLVSAVQGGVFDDVEERPLYYRNYELTSPVGAGEGSGGGDAG
jgi:nucleoside-diphosphate-sugar epimerase